MNPWIHELRPDKALQPTLSATGAIARLIEAQCCVAECG